MSHIDWKPSRYVKGVLVCVPAFGQQMTAHTGQSLYNLAQFLTFKNIPNSMCWLSAADIGEVRNLVLTKWYDGHPEYSHLLFIDADMEFPTALVRDMLGFGKPLTGCLYARRQWPATAVGRTFTDGDTVDDVKQGFMKVAGTGAGVMLIARHVVERMLDIMPEIIDRNVSGHPGAATLEESKSTRLIRAFDPFVDERGVKLSEDLAFCARWRACGGDVWANVNHLIGHIGTMNYAIRYADYLETKAAAKLAQLRVVA